MPEPSPNNDRQDAASPATATRPRDHRGSDTQLGALTDAIELAVHAVVHGDPGVSDIRTRLTDALDTMVVLAQRDQDLRGDIDAATVRLLLTTQFHTRPGESITATVDRMLPILVDGLRPPERPAR